MGWVRLTFVILTFWGTHALSDAPSCREQIGKLASVNIGFNYANLGISLTSPQNDAHFYQKLGLAMGSKKSALVMDQPGLTKQVFLKKLAAQAKDSDTVFLTYSGHGIVGPTGEFQMLIPPPASCFIQKQVDLPQLQRGFYSESTVVQGLSKAKQEGLSARKVKSRALEDAQGFSFADDAQKAMASPRASMILKDECLDKYVVNASEILETLKGKKVVGIIDSCHAGAIQQLTESRKEAVTILHAAAAGQEAAENGNFGAFTSQIQDLVAASSCRVDINSNGKIDFTELSKHLNPVYFPLDAKEYQTRKTSPTIPVAFTEGPPQVKWRPSGQIPGISSSEKGKSLGRCLEMPYDSKLCSEFVSEGVAKFDYTAKEDTVLATLENYFPKEDDEAYCKVSQGTPLKIVHLTYNEWVKVAVPKSNTCKTGVGWVVHSELNGTRKTRKPDGIPNNATPASSAQ